MAADELGAAEGEAAGDFELHAAPTRATPRMPNRNERLTWHLLGSVAGSTGQEVPAIGMRCGDSVATERPNRHSRSPVLGSFGELGQLAMRSSRISRYSSRRSYVSAAPSSMPDWSIPSRSSLVSKTAVA